jgi:hypothetical protein
MPDNLTPIELPSIGEKLSALLGFKLPTLALPQTARNLDKAAARLIAASAGNLASRIERNTSLREAKTKAETRIIDAAGSYLVDTIEDDKALAERALEFSFCESVLKQTNREKIVTLAIEDLSSKTTEGSADATSEIDDDWLNHFSEFASHKSNAEIQSLWAKILSGKIRNPSSFSLQSLQLLSSLDTNDAVLIHEVLSYSINLQFIYRCPDWKDIKRFITCEDLGVLSGTTGNISIALSVAQENIPMPQLSLWKYFFTISNKVVLIASIPTGVSLPIPIFNLTRFGRELLSLSEGFERDTKYGQEFIAFLKLNRATVQRALIETGHSSPLEDV